MNELENASRLSALSAATDISRLSKLSLYCPHTPSPRQREFLALGCREAMYGGRAGCGKSDVLIMGALQGIAIPQYSAMLFRRTYKDLMLSGALLDRMHSWFDGSPAVWSEEDKWFTFPSGARICVGYADAEKDVHRYKSAEFHFIGFDEGSEFSPYQLRFMHGRMRRTGDFPKSLPLRYRIATNPGGPSHDFLMKRFNIATTDRFPAGAPPVVTKDASGEPRVFFPAHAQDNPGLDWKDYHRSLAELPPVQRMQYEEGIWVQDSAGLCYPSVVEGKARLIGALPPGHDWRFGMALDIGASNNCAIAIGAWCDDLPESYLTHTVEPEGLDTPRDVAMYVKKLDEQYHFEFMVGDHGGLGKGYLNEMRKWFQLPIMNVDKNDKPGYIKLLDGAMANKMAVIIEAGCETFLEQAKALLWKDEKQLDEKPGMRNHSCDAWLYLWRRMQHYSHTAKDQNEVKMDDLELRIIAEQSRIETLANDFGVSWVPEGYV